MIVDCTGRVVTRTAATEASYGKLYVSLRRQSARETGKEPNDGTLLRWFFAQNRRWRPATVRLYRAGLRYVIERIEAAGAITKGDADLLRQQLAKAPEPLQKGTGPRRGATKKRKTVTEKEVLALACELENGDQWDQLAARFLVINLSLSLRPSEYTGAVLEGSALKVRNGKATNGRGHSAIKSITVPSATADHPDFPPVLRTFLKHLDTHRVMAGSEKRLWSRLASRLGRACQRLSIRRVSPYTTRHVALATAKQQMSPEEVAALAGHRTTATAVTHYARRRSGLAQAIVCARPDPAAVEKVISSPKSTRTANFDHRRGSTIVYPASRSCDGGADRQQPTANSAVQFQPPTIPRMNR